MSLPKLCIQRPVFTIVLSLLITIIGCIQFDLLPMQRLPKINQAKVSINTEYPGASPKLIESSLTTPIENVISGISGLELIKSNSSLGQSSISMTFKMGTDLSDALSEIRNKVASLQAYLPEGIKGPVISQNDSNSNPTIIIGFHALNLDSLYITDYLKRYIKPQMEQIAGVGQVFLFGEQNYAINIWLDPEKMAARQLTVTEIKQALKEQNLDIPSGELKGKMRRYTVVTHAKLKSLEQFKNLIIRDDKGLIVRLRDVAEIKVEAQEIENIFRFNGNAGVGLAIIPQTDANPVMVSKRVLSFFNNLKTNLPSGLKAEVIYDAAVFIEHSIKEVFKTFIEASLFVTLIILLFLGNLRAAFIPLITVPICIIASFYPMHLLGFSLNTITLLALVLAIGLVVDDAIVILENIDRHILQGKKVLDAASVGSLEVQFAIIAMTLTLAAVFIPLAFLKGFIGTLFFEFGITLAIAVLFSGFVALTLSPMMCSRLLKAKRNPYSLWLEKQFEWIKTLYQKSLTYWLTHQSFSVISLLILLTLGFFLFQSLPKELAPTEDQGAIIGLLNSPENASLDYTFQYTQGLENIYQNTPAKTAFLTVTKPGGIFSILKLTPWEKRTINQQTIADKINQNMQELSGVSGFTVNPSPLGRRSSNNSIVIHLLSFDSFDVLKEMANQLVERLKQVPGLNNPNAQLLSESMQYDIDINREMKADLKLGNAGLADLISTMLGGANPIDFEYKGQRYKVLMQLKKEKRIDTKVIDNLFILSSDKKIIPFSNIATIKPSVKPSTLVHYNQMKSIDITAELAPNYSMSHVLPQINKELKANLPEDIKYQYGGDIADFLQSKGATITAFLTALLFIYLILCAQFESFVMPFIVLLTVPISLVGALLSLKLFGGSLNIYSNIGMVTLIGLISKHGILITEFSNQLRLKGHSLKDALIKGASQRLRPILMTTFAMVLGALPLAFASGAGAEARRQLGMVIVGGMSIGTLLSLFIVPFAYHFILSKISPDNR